MNKYIKKKNSLPILMAAVNALTSPSLKDFAENLPVAIIPTFNLGDNCTDILFFDGHIKTVKKSAKKVFNDFLLTSGRSIQSLKESHNIKKLHKHQVFLVDDNHTFITLDLREDSPYSSLSSLGFVNARVLNIEQMEMDADQHYLISSNALRKVISLSLLPKSSSSIPMPLQLASDLKGKVMYKIYDDPKHVKKLFTKAEKLYSKKHSSIFHFTEANVNISLFTIPSSYEEIQKMQKLCTHSSKLVLTESFNPAKDILANTNNASLISVLDVKHSCTHAKYNLEKERRTKSEQRKGHASNQLRKLSDTLH